MNEQHPRIQRDSPSIPEVWLVRHRWPTRRSLGSAGLEPDTPRHGRPIQREGQHRERLQPRECHRRTRDAFGLAYSGDTLVAAGSDK